MLAAQPEVLGSLLAVLMVFTLAGLWPYTRPTDAVATVLAEAGMPPALESIGTTLRDMLVRQLAGTLALAASDRD